MSTEQNIDPEIERLISGQAEEQGIPEGLLRELYVEERKVVNMEKRRGIHEQVKKKIEKYGEDWEP